MERSSSIWRRRSRSLVSMDLLMCRGGGGPARAPDRPGLAPGAARVPSVACPYRTQTLTKSVPTAAGGRQAGAVRSGGHPVAARWPARVGADELDLDDESERPGSGERPVPAAQKFARLS